MWTLSPTHTGRIKASVFEVDPKVLSRNAPESIGESKHFTIASSLRGEVTATRKIAPLGISIRAPTRSVLDDRHNWPIVMPAQA